MNIFEDRFRPLFMLFLARSMCTFTWTRAETFDGNTVLRRALCLRKLPKAHQRTASRRVYWIFGLRQEVIEQANILQVMAPHTSFTPSVHKHIAELSRVASHGNVLGWKWTSHGCRLLASWLWLHVNHCSVPGGTISRWPKT